MMLLDRRRLTPWILSPLVSSPFDEYLKFCHEHIVAKTATMDPHPIIDRGNVDQCKTFIKATVSCRDEGTFATPAFSLQSRRCGVVLVLAGDLHWPRPGQGRDHQDVRVPNHDEWVLDSSREAQFTCSSRGAIWCLVQEVWFKKWWKTVCWWVNVSGSQEVCKMF